MTLDAERPPRRWWWRATWTVIALALASAAVSARVVLAGEAEIAASTEALRAGNAREAAVRARRAAEWYAPGAPHVRVAYDRLMALGREAEKRHQKDLALFAYEGVREAAIATRWIVTPRAAEVAEAEAAIARLRSTDDRPPATASEPDVVIERQLLTDLAARPGPKRTTSALLGASFLAFTGGLAWVLARAVDATGRLDRRRAWPGLLVSAAAALAWLILLFVA